MSLVLWKPPSGVVDNVMQAVRSSKSEVTSSDGQPQSPTPCHLMESSVTNSRTSPEPPKLAEIIVPQKTVFNYAFTSNETDFDEDAMEF